MLHKTTAFLTVSPERAKNFSSVSTYVQFGRISPLEQTANKLAIFSPVTALAILKCMFHNMVDYGVF